MIGRRCPKDYKDFDPALIGSSASERWNWPAKLVELCVSLARIQAKIIKVGNEFYPGSIFRRSGRCDCRPCRSRSRGGRTARIRGRRSPRRRGGRRDSRASCHQQEQEGIDDDLLLFVCRTRTRKGGRRCQDPRPVRTPRSLPTLKNPPSLSAYRLFWSEKGFVKSISG